MPEIHYVVMPGDYLMPASDHDQALMGKWKKGDVVKGKFTRPRNGKHHRKAMVLLEYVLQNQDKYTDLKHLMSAFKIAAGWYEEFITPDGMLVYIPKSISFEDCDQSEFDVLYSKFIDIAISDYLPRGYMPSQLDSYVMNVLSFD